jgi:hypothetical protein
LFQQGDYRNKGHKPPKKLSWIQAPVKMFSVPWKVMVKKNSADVIVLFSDQLRGFIYNCLAWLKNYSLSMTNCSIFAKLKCQ